MLQLLNGGLFLSYVAEQRILWLSGVYGSGKTSLAVALAYLLLRHNRAKYCVSNTPIAFAIPAEHCPPRDFVVVMDEVGVFFDSRSFADRKQNEFTKMVGAFMRKVNIYALMASRVAPDARFRALTVQRVFDFRAIFPLEVYSFVSEEGKNVTDGYFGLLHRDWLWSKLHPSPLYDHSFIPSGFRPIQRLLEKAIESGGVEDEDVNAWPDFSVEAFKRWFGVGSVGSGDIGSPALGGGSDGDSAVSGDTPAVVVGGGVHGGMVAPRVDVAGRNYNL